MSKVPDVTRREDPALSSWSLHQTERDWKSAALYCSGWDTAGFAEAVEDADLRNNQHDQRPRPGWQSPPPSCRTLWRVNWDLCILIHAVFNYALLILLQTVFVVLFYHYVYCFNRSCFEITAFLVQSDLCQRVCEGGVREVFLRLSAEGAETPAPKAVQTRGQSQGSRRVQLLQQSQQLYHLVQDGAGEARKYFGLNLQSII